MRGRKPEIRPGQALTTGADAPLMPESLSADARIEWERVLEMIGAAGAITISDADLLATYCETLVLFKRAMKQVSEEGITFTSDDGMIKRHPATAIAADARKDLVRFAAELGMTPIARQRLKVNPQDRDELENLFGNNDC